MIQNQGGLRLEPSIELLAWEELSLRLVEPQALLMALELVSSFELSHHHSSHPIPLRPLVALAPRLPLQFALDSTLHILRTFFTCFHKARRGHCSNHRWPTFCEHTCWSKIELLPNC